MFGRKGDSARCANIIHRGRRLDAIFRKRLVASNRAFARASVLGCQRVFRGLGELLGFKAREKEASKF